MSAIGKSNQKTLKAEAKEAAPVQAAFEPNEWFDRMDVLVGRDSKTMREVIKSYQVGQVLKSANPKAAEKLALPEHLRIVLCGFRGAGKSAIVNTLKTALDPRPDIDVKDVAPTHHEDNVQELVTTSKAKYPLTENIVLIDTKGLPANPSEDDLYEIVNIVHASVPKQAEPIASPGQHVAQRKPVEDFDPLPCHVVALVLSANHTKEELEAMQRLEKILRQDNIPSLYVITKVDIEDASNAENKQGAGYQDQQDRFKNIEDRARVAVVQNYSAKSRKVDERINQFALYTLLRIVRRGDLFGLPFVPKQTSEIVVEQAMSVPKAALVLATQRKQVTAAVLVLIFALLFAYYATRPGPEPTYEFKD